jgi:aurora kinase, other
MVQGDLFDLLRNTGGRMKEGDVAKRILCPFMAGLAYLHSLHIIHRDIKLENTLFSADGTLKIADFGLSVDTSMEHPVTRLGTLDYMSPGVLSTRVTYCIGFSSSASRSVSVREAGCMGI